MGAQGEGERFEPDSPAAWSAWLAENHTRGKGVWLVTPRKGTGRQVVDYETAVTEALRYGWVDATQRSLDAERTMLWFAPRRPHSGWAASNKARVERLRAEGRLEPAGEEAVRVARENGSWTLLDDVELLVVPGDLADELAARPGTRAHWDALPVSARRAALTHLVQARRPETRRRRIDAMVEKLANGERP
jgi:uncharacterized protein YdeI (YjbR/CyaY-like superfamily)